MFRGRCLCGRVKYSISSSLRGAYMCHCSLCRKQGSTASNLATIVDAASFSWDEGSECVNPFRKNTGFSSYFCRVCGSTVPNPLRSSPHVWIPLGALEGDLRPQVVAHIYAESRASWDTMPLEGNVFDTMPPLEEFLAMLDKMHTSIHG